MRNRTTGGILGPGPQSLGRGNLLQGFKPNAKPKPGVPKPPAGYYDPALDAQERAAGRGLGDLRIDTDTANQRASTQYMTDTGRFGEDKATSLANLLRDKTRASTDLATGYQNLGVSQSEAASAAGVGAGGTLAAALAKRAANEKLQQDRLTEDFNANVADVNRSYDRSMADAGTQYQYGVDDRGLSLGRAERENIFFGQDTAAERDFQAAQAGYVPPATPPKPKGKPKQTIAQRVTGSGSFGAGAVPPATVVGPNRAAGAGRTTTKKRRR